MNEPVAYFLTWTCYGAWLHGDERGSVAPGSNVPNTELVPANQRRVRFEEERMNAPAVTLRADERTIVKRAIEEHARWCQWDVHAINVRSNHVHVVVANAGVAPEKMLTSFKAWATRQLREAGRTPADGRVWTRHGSTRYLWTDANIAAAVAYVEEGQDVPR